VSAATTIQSPCKGKSTDLCVWLLVASPFVFGTISAMVDQNIGAKRDGMAAAVVIGLFVTFSILVDIDSNRIRRAGRTPPCFWWFIFPPVYLWKRVGRTDSSRMIGGMFCAVLAGGVAMQYPALTHGCFAGIGLPACNASIAVYEVKGVINQTAHSSGITALQLHDILQTAFDGATRSCWGKVYKSNGTDHAYRYQLRLANGTLVTEVTYAGR
jgi:hypothetical protein